MERACICFAWWAIAINAAAVMDNVPKTKWFWDKDTAGQDCHEICGKQHFRCKEDAILPSTKEDMEKIARENKIQCDSFCLREDFSQAPLIIPTGEEYECRKGNLRAGGQQCIYNKANLDADNQEWCSRKFIQRIRICPCIESTPSAAAPDTSSPAPKAATIAREMALARVLRDESSEITTSAPTTTKGTTPPTTRADPPPPTQPTKKKPGVIANVGFGDVDLVLLVVIATGSASGLFFITILVAACVCTCRRKRSREGSSRRGGRSRSSRHSSSRSRRTSSRRSSRRKGGRRSSRKARRGPASSSGPTSTSSSSRSRGRHDRRNGRLRRDRQSSHARTTAMVHTVVHMADNEYDDSAFSTGNRSPRAGPYNVDSELYGMDNEELTLTEMLETYGNRNY